MAWDRAYVGALGLVAVLAGVVELVAGVSGDDRSLAFVTVSGTFLLWRGVIVASAGAFFLRAAVDGLDAQRQRGIVVLGAIMLWIVAGSDLLGRVLGAVPGGRDVWVGSVDGIVGSVAPPYAPAVVLAPLALPAIRYWLADRGRPTGGVDG